MVERAISYSHDLPPSNTFSYPDSSAPNYGKSIMKEVHKSFQWGGYKWLENVASTNANSG
jgi:hypothetical protein